MENAVVLKAHLEDKADEEYYAYGVAVIEDRAIFGDIDGLKPVTRRALWATHKLGLHHTAPHEKSAKVVGETMGNYHPHGDSAIYGAIVTAANAPQRMFDGDGNWGTMTDPPAAMRYTNCRLSKYSDTVFFNKFYLAVRDEIANYDDSRKEPLILPSLLPNALLNGNFGIAPGVRTQTPTVTLESLLPVLAQAFKKGKCTPEMCMDLEYTTEYGARMRETKTLRSELKQFLKTGKGRFVFDSVAKQHDGNSIRIDRFAPFANIGTVLGNVEGIAGVQFTRDDSDKSDRYEKAYVIGFSKTTTGGKLKMAIRRVMECFSSAVTYNLQATDRFMDPTRPDGGKELYPTTVPQLIQVWCEYRVALEKRACKYWIGQRQVEIDYLNLMRLAVKSRKFIIEALNKPLDDTGLAAYIAKGLKITVEQANQILDLKVRQLKALDDKMLADKVKNLREEIAGYSGRIKNPQKYIIPQLKEFGEGLRYVPRVAKTRKSTKKRASRRARK